MSPIVVVSVAAVIRVVTQRFCGGEALRDDSNNGCGGDYYSGERGLVVYSS